MSFANGNSPAASQYQSPAGLSGLQPVVSDSATGHSDQRTFAENVLTHANDLASPGEDTATLMGCLMEKILALLQVLQDLHKVELALQDVPVQFTLGH